MTNDDMFSLLIEKLRWLRLPGMVEQLREILDEAQRSNLTALEAVDRLADAEKTNRLRNAINKRIRDARFAEVNTIDAFDFDFDPTRKKLRARYLALHDLTFLERGINPLFIGAPGTGKTFLARALAYRACQQNKRVLFCNAPRMLTELHGAELHGSLERALRRYVRPALLVIDDFAVLAMDPTQAKLAFQVISERHELRRSTAVTTNRVFKDWTKVFPDPLNAQIIAERLTERAEHFLLDKNFRMTHA